LRRVTDTAILRIIDCTRKFSVVESVFRKLTTKSEAVNVSKVLYKHYFYIKLLHWFSPKESSSGKNVW